MVDLHKAVKIALAMNGGTITELAGRIDVNRKTLYSAIQGNATLKTVSSIAKALDMKPSELVKLGE